MRNYRTEPRNRSVSPDGWRLPIVPAPGTGVVTPSCEDRTRYPVAQHVGRMLRQGSEIALCFACGPEGGVYHPDDADMPTIRMRAERIFLHDGDGNEPPTAAEIAAFDAEMRRAFGEGPGI